jgi:hypothetical protein
LVKLFSALSHHCFPRHFTARKMQQKKRWWLMTTSMRNPQYLAMMNIFGIGFRFCHISYTSEKANCWWTYKYWV